MWRTFLCMLVLFVGCLHHDADIEVEPQPQPTPNPVEPIEPGPLKVLILYENDDFKTMPSSQVNAIQSTKLRAWLKENKADYRIWDQHTDTSAADPFWQKAVKLPHERLPWMWISAGNQTRDGAMPATIDETLKLLDTAIH